MTWAPPDELEEYRIVRPLGAGAMGAVFLAHDTLLDRPVAIKFVSGEVGAAARERFFTEARAIARLGHPNVVGIHRVGEIRRRPYLVSEYVRGASLAAIAKPLPWERALKIALGLARGLASAHRRGVLHRDLKPANIVLDDEDEPKLLDFGLAKLLEATSEPRTPRARPQPAVADVAATRSLPGRVARSLDGGDGEGALTADGALVGTPLYLAPELWRGETATRRTDVYALGVVLYELLAGRAPHAGLGVDELAVRARTVDPAPIATLAPDLPARLAELIDACVARDPARRPASGDAVRELLEAVVPHAPALVEGSPYRGLSAFEPEHRALFFGRGEEARAIVDRLRAEAIVVVAGDSGAGKSSLCRAAVVPAIAEMSLAGRRWRTATIVPGAHPGAQLDAALTTSEDGAGLLLFVDQLEELLTVAAPGEAHAFAERLSELVVASASTRVLASARSDFLGRLAALPGLGELVGRALFLLGPLSDRGVREAIVGPARAAGYELAPAMVDELVASGRHLPLLQFTLAELWEARDDQRREIPADALARIGGVGGALARRADQVIAALGDGERELAWRILVRLMTAEGTRAALTRDELGEIAGDRAAVERIVERLVAARLLVVAAGGSDRVEVVHEALFTAWPRFVEWRRDHDHDARMRDLHAEAARRWDERGRQRGLLWRGEALAEHRAWRRRWPERPTRVEAAFDRACEADARRSHRVQFTVLALVLAALSSGVVILYRSDRRAASERDVAEKRRAEAEGERRMLYVERGVQELSKGNSARALPYLVQALRDGDGTPALRFLLGEAVRPLEREIAVNRDLAAGVAAIAWSRDGTRIAALARDGALVLFDRDGDRIHTLQQLPMTAHLGGHELIAFSPDDTQLAVARGRTVQLWDVAAGTLAHELRGHTEDAISVDYDGAGERVSSYGRDGTVRLWDPRTGALRGVIDVGTDSLIACHGSTPDGTQLAIGFADGSVRVFDTAIGRERFRLAAAMTFGCAIELTGDGERMLTAGLDVQLWDLRSRTPIALLVKGTGPATLVARVTADGTRIATGGADGLVRIWDGHTGALVHHLTGHTTAIRSMRFSASGERLVTCGLDGTFRIWDVTTGVLETTFEAATTSPSIGGAMTIDAQFSRDGARLLMAVGSELQIVRTSREGYLEELGGPAYATTATLSPDETQVAIGGYHGGLEVWDRARRERLAVFELGAGVWDVSWRADGNELLVAGKQGILQFHAPLGGPPTRRLVGHDPAFDVNRATFSPDQTRIASASSDGTARIWDARTSQELRVLRHDGRVMAAAWSPDGTRIATSCWDQGLRLWDAASGQLLFELRDPSLRFLDTTFSPDGARLAATHHSGAVTIWDLATRRRTLTLIGHTGPVSTAVWSADGTMVASTSSDMTARIWDVATGRLLATRSHGGEALQATWSRSGNQLVVATPIPGAKIWEVGRERRSVAELVELVRTRVPWKLVDGRLEIR